MSMYVHVRMYVCTYVHAYPVDFCNMYLRKYVGTYVRTLHVYVCQCMLSVNLL